MNRRTQMLLWAALLAFLIFYPALFGPYYTNLFVTFAVFAAYSVSLNVLLGYTGLLSFGHAMFFGAGGYGTALALKHIPGLPLIPAVLIGFLSALFLALLFSPLMVRATGTAFAMLHLAFGQLMYVLALKLRSVTGGEDGIGGFPIPSLTIPGLGSISMKDPTNFYYFGVAVLGLSIWLMWFFTKTPLGQVQIGIRDNAKRIDYLGYKVPQTKALVYVMSGAFAGVAGAIFALFQSLVSADGALGIMVSFAPLTNTVIGGIGSFFGPIWGTAIFQIIQEISVRYTERVELVQGLIMVLVMMFAPTGFVGFIQSRRQKRAARILASASKAEPEKA